MVCPKIQFSSDTNQLKSVQNPQLQGSVTLDCPTSDANLKWGDQIPHISAWLTTNLGVPVTPLWFYNYLEWFTELRKKLYFLLLVYYKGTTEAQVNDRDSLMEGGAWRFHTFPAIHPRSTSMCSPTWKSSLNLMFKSFYGFLKWNDWLNNWILVIISSLSSLSGGCWIGLCG